MIDVDQPSAKLLYVEDDEDLRELNADMFSGAGFDVTSESSAESALERLRGNHYAAVVTDYNLTRETGAWLLRTASSEGHLERTAAIVLTSAESPAGVEKYRVMRKPVDFAMLCAGIREAIGEMAPKSKAIKRRSFGTIARMSSKGLAEFIDAERTTIIAEWETFARSLLPAATGMSAMALRDHADQILTAIVLDMKSRQTDAEQTKKSKGKGQAQHLEETGKLHAALRIETGFKLDQLVAEYRALRASVLRLWEKHGADPEGVTRFNEAVDEALTEAVKRFMETTERFRDQSIGILGHDLRNPLSGIITGATMLIGSEELGDRSVKIAARMLNSANRMNRMISDLLDLTRTRFGDPIPVVRVPMDLDPLCRQVVAELEAHHAIGGIQFTPKGDLRGEWDGDRIAQVLSNLLRNAIQHGGQSDPIRLVAHGDGDHVILEIHNAGAIPKSALVTIFEPMVRHVEDEQTNKGLGLGLYIALQVVLAHEGTLDVKSTAASGTTFTVHLPRRAAIKKATRVRASERPPA